MKLPCAWQRKGFLIMQKKIFLGVFGLIFAILALDSSYFEAYASSASESLSNQSVQSPQAASRAGESPIVSSEAPNRIRMSIVGGIGGVSQYTNFEEPFWQREITEKSDGRIIADIKAFDRSGIRGAEMLPLMRLGVTPFGTALLAVVSQEEPELNAIDLPLVSDDIESLRRATEAYRPHLASILSERYDIKLLALYTYPAQVVYCRRSFVTLADLKGRRVRVSSVGQSELMTALGAIPVITSFAEIMPTVRAGVVDCAVTGTLSGNTIGLHEIMTHMHSTAITWGIGIFGANQGRWNALPGWAKEVLTREVGDLERRIWDAVEQETTQGIICNAGQPGCSAGRRGNMTVLPISAQDKEIQQRLLRETILPRWLNRCGVECVEAWNDYLSPVTRVTATQP